MFDRDEYNEALLEKSQQLAEALNKAEAGVATREEWDLIRHECQCPRPFFSQAHRSEA